MNKEQLTHFKEKLTEELGAVEIELASLGWENPETGEWEAAERDMDVMSPMADPNEAADKVEEYDENRAELDEIQIHWRNIKRALTNIEEGIFGICEVCGIDIEDDRLEVNPSARTCKAHMEDEVDLLA